MRSNESVTPRAQGVAVVRRRLVHASAALLALEARAAALCDDTPATVPAPTALAAARRGHTGVRAVLAWLDAAAPADAAEAAATPELSLPTRNAPVAPGTNLLVELAAHLQAASDDLAALGEALEEEDPLLHFEAVQAVGLAVAVLEAAYRQLLRAGLIAPRPVDLLQP